MDNTMIKIIPDTEIELSEQWIAILDNFDLNYEDINEAMYTSDDKITHYIDIYKDDLFFQFSMGLDLKSVIITITDSNNNLIEHDEYEIYDDGN
jgi:hypothetical protein